MTPAATGWAALTAELDLWAAQGQQVDLWWRDDDAISVTPPLEQLLSLQREAGIPLALAIIPGLATPDLARRLSGQAGIFALQHGFMHCNHAPAGSKKSEFPAARPLEQRLADLRAGRNQMQAWFADRLLPIMVPPWNRMADDLLPQLAGCGFTAISAFAPRKDYWAASGLVWLNTHIDPIDWHGGGGIARSVEIAANTLGAMRLGLLPLQPIGLLTHHLRHDPAVWTFVRDFFDATRHPAARWIDAATALAAGTDSPVIARS